MSQIRPVEPRLQFFEDALHKTGWGLYYKFLMGFVCINLLTHGLVFFTLYFALPLSACDTGLTEDNFIAIHISFAIGRAIGGFFLCTISDNTGKKCMISKSLIIIFASCFVSAFSHNTYTLYLAAFFLGSGLEANFIASSIYITELLPMEKRGFYMIFTNLFWTFGYFTSAIFIYYFGIINTPNLEHQGMDMRLTSWRIIFAIGGGFCITMACSSALLEISPRHLLFKRRIITATLILKQFYAINKSKYSETFDIQSQQLYDVISDFNINIEPDPPIGIMQQIITLFKIILRTIRLIFLKKQFFKVALVITFLKVPTMLGITSWTIWLSQHLNDMNKTQINGFNFLHLSLIYDERNQCSIGFNDGEFQLFLMISINILTGQLLLLLIIDKIGRKYPIFAGLTICSFSSIILAYSQQFIVAIIAASCFIMSFAIVEAIIFVILTEALPTALRGTAHGVTNFYRYIAVCFIYQFLEVNHQIFFIIMGAITLGMSILSCSLPELAKRPMVEKIP